MLINSVCVGRLKIPCRWSQHDPPKRWYPTKQLHVVTTKKTSTWIADIAFNGEPNKVAITSESPYPKFPHTGIMKQKEIHLSNKSEVYILVQIFFIPSKTQA